MYFVTYAILLTSILLGCLAATGARAEEGNSTYNFYFQKAPGPVTVNQGGAPAAATVLPGPAVTPPPLPPAVNPVGVSVVAPLEETSTPRRFYFSLGYALGMATKAATRYENVTMQKKEYLSGQYALKGEYELTHRFSLTGEVYMLEKDVTLGRATPFFHNGRYVFRDEAFTTDVENKSAKNVLDFSLGAAFHLVRLQATTLSLTGGLVTVPYIRYEDLGDSRPGSAGGLALAQAVDHDTTLFVGTRLRLLADNVWGLDLSFKAIPAAKLNVAQLNLAFAI